MKKICKVLMILLLAGFLLPCGQGIAKTQLQWALGGVGGTFYVLGSPIAKYVNDHSETIQVTPTSGGGVENVRRVNRGEAQLGFIGAADMYKGWNGIDPFNEKLRDWSTIGIASKTLLYHAVSLVKYNIKSLEDVKGRIFSIGPPVSGGAAIMEELLSYTGLDKQMTIRKLPHSDVATMLKDGKIHVFGRYGSIPVSSVEEVAVEAKMSLVDFGPIFEKFPDYLKERPYFMKEVIKGGTYKGEDRDITTFGTAAYIFVNKNVSEELVYEFTRHAYSDGCIKSMDMAFDGHNLNRKKPLAGNIGPVHPGAAKFWKEVGIEIPEPYLK